MTAHVPRLPPSVDLLIAEAKQRARRRRAVVAALFLLAAAGVAAGVLAIHSPAGASGKAAGSQPSAEIRSCGLLGVGIGWHVAVSSASSCRSGRAFARAYFRPGGRTHSRAQGYACSNSFLSAGERIRCVRGEKTVIVTSAGY
jgi:hypothetical protein